IYYRVWIFAVVSARCYRSSNLSPEKTPNATRRLGDGEMPIQADRPTGRHEPRYLMLDTMRRKCRSLAALLMTANICFAVSMTLSTPYAYSQAASSSQSTEDASSVSSLIGVKPILPDASEYIQDIEAARQLGKALFWDTQAGSDGVACASCHFQAG